MCVIFYISMNNNSYTYEEWLSGHAGRKTTMEKLERSLIPYELFAAIGLTNDKELHTLTC